MHDVKCLRWVYRLNSNIFSTKHINGLIPRMINKSKKIEKWKMQKKFETRNLFTYTTTKIRLLTTLVHKYVLYKHWYRYINYFLESKNI